MKCFTYFIHKDTSKFQFISLYDSILLLNRIKSKNNHSRAN